MKKIFTIIYKCHKWFGIPLGVMFIVWYVSGMVMLYHGFPNLASSERPVGSVDSIELKRLWNEVPDTFSNCRFTFSGRKLQIQADDCLIGAYNPSKADIDEIAASFGCSVERIDTLNDIDKWIPFNRHMRHLPIYRVVDNEGAFTYVSSKTGEVIQRNTVSERRWAWFGALPHYVYITPLRRDAGLWRSVVIVLAGFSTISVCFGIIIAVRFLVRRRSLVIFKKKVWQWHYLIGLFFGISMLTFIFSGMMSLAKIPDWIVETCPLKNPVSRGLSKRAVDLDAIPEDFGQIEISFTSQPMMRVTSGEDFSVLSPDPVVPLDFSDTFMAGYVEHVTGERVRDISDVSKGVFYRRSIPGKECHTENFTACWNDHGFFKVMDSNAKAQTICYRFLHNMQIPVIERNPVVHDVFMWILLLGGLSITLTGLVLSLRAVRIRVRSDR